MTLRDILQTKGSLVHTIDCTATLQDVVDKLVSHNCGSLVVCDPSANGPMAGIITERDILRACSKHQTVLANLNVCDVMSKDVVVGTPGDTIESAMGLMTNRRIRHLPVIENGELVGMISIGDVVKTQHDHLSMENHYLKNYLHST